MSTEKPFLPDALIPEVDAALLKRYQGYLQPGESVRVVSGEADADAWTLQVVFENADKTVRLPLEAAVQRTDLPETNPEEVRGILLDFVGHFFDRYFKGGRVATLPIDWQEFPAGEHTVYARGWQRNLQLEEAADRFLAGEAIDEFLSPRERSRRSN